jgi:ABC-2 type transport system permease protein
VRNDQSIKPPSSVQQNVPAWLIFAMFFVVIPISSIFIIERQQGTLQRLRAMGVPFRLLLAGKLLPFFVVNQLQAVLMVLVGLFVVPMFGGEALDMPTGSACFNWWAVSVAVSLAAVAWALLVASLARTSEQATIVGGVSNILMGAIGGVMVPKFVMPAFMQKLAALSPMAWGLDGFHTVMLRHGSFADLLPSLLPLLAFAILSLALAAWLNQRSLAAHS